MRRVRMAEASGAGMRGRAADPASGGEANGSGPGRSGREKAMTIMLRMFATLCPMLRRGAVASVVAVGLGGVAQAAQPAEEDAHAPPSMGGVPGSPDAMEPAGTPGQAPTGVHELGGGHTGRGADVDPVSPGGLGSGISTNTQPSGVGSAGSVGSSTTASPTSR